MKRHDKETKLLGAIAGPLQGISRTSSLGFFMSRPDGGQYGVSLLLVQQVSA